MESIVSRIQKLLALGERAGTEAEADSAMQKVHQLLAKHNLSIDDVKAPLAQDEDYIRDLADATARQPWQGFIWSAIARLYFCQHFTRKSRDGFQRMIIGKPSNIAVVKYMAAYIILTGETLAKEAAKTSDSKRTFVNSFKKGFSYRVYGRVNEEIKKACEGKMTDSVTGTALIVSPLYDKTKTEIDAFLLNNQIRPKNGGGGKLEISNRDGFAAGREAANGISLASNGIGQTATPRLIGCK